MSNPPEKSELSSVTMAVRTHDNDRYLCALFAPAERRQDLLALYAFNLEIAKTREAVSEAMLGQIRLQWWRDALASIFAGSPPAQDVAVALAGAVHRHGLSRNVLESLIDAREFDLEERQPRDLNELVAYARATSANLTALALRILGEGEGAVAKAGENVGIAWALTGLLRALPFHARAHRCFLPAALAKSAGLDDAGYFAQRSSPALAAVVRVMAEEARDNLQRAREVADQVPRAALPALLPAVLADAWLDRLKRAKFDPFTPRLQAPSAGRAFRVGWAALRGRY